MIILFTYFGIMLFFSIVFVELCISYGVLVCCISLKCACLAMIFFFVECIIVLLLCDAIHYSCNAMTSLIFYLNFLKNVSLLLWVVVLVIVVVVFFFFFFFFFFIVFFFFFVGCFFFFFFFCFFFFFFSLWI